MCLPIARGKMRMPSGIVLSAPSPNRLQPKIRRSLGVRYLEANKPIPTPARPRVNATATSSGTVTVRFRTRVSGIRPAGVGPALMPFYVGHPTHEEDRFVPLLNATSLERAQRFARGTWFKVRSTRHFWRGAKGAHESRVARASDGSSSSCEWPACTSEDFELRMADLVLHVA